MSVNKLPKKATYDYGYTNSIVRKEIAMGWEDDGPPEYEDIPEYEDNPEETEKVLQRNVEIPDVWWKEYIAQIKDPVLQDKSIERAKPLEAEGKELDRKVESGEIDEIDHWGVRLCDLGPKEHAASFEAQLAAEDLTWDKLADLAEDNALVQKGDIGTLEQKEQNKELIKEVGVDKSQEIADRLFEEEKIDKEGYDSVSRLIRNQK